MTWARRLVDWRRIPGKWWPVIVLFWLGFDLVMAGLAVLMRVTDSPLDVNGSLFCNPGPLLFLLLISFVFPAVEEVGLRISADMDPFIIAGFVGFLKRKGALGLWY